jgi:hypothetical protein
MAKFFDSKRTYLLLLRVRAYEAARVAMVGEGSTDSVPAISWAISHLASAHGDAAMNVFWRGQPLLHSDRVGVVGAPC